MSYNFQNFKDKLAKIEEWLKNEYASMRTGRATVSLLDKVLVDAYGVKTPLNQVASINSEDAKTLKITPWDNSQIKAIEKGIALADIGVSTASDEKGVRVIFPELTAERRDLLVKQIGKILEEGRIRIRKEREDVWGDIQKQEKDGNINEDEKFRAKDEMQKIVDDFQKKLEEIYQNKEKEIKSQ